MGSLFKDDGGSAKTHLRVNIAGVGECNLKENDGDGYQLDKKSLQGNTVYPSKICGFISRLDNLLDSLDKGDSKE